jgi:uncharacterized membrane-anchored protein YitT (DUF2179 family)
MDTQRTPVPAATPHSTLEDLQGLLTGCLFVALAVVLFRETRLLTGGTTGLAFVLHYLSQWPLGAWLFVVNLPFYVFAWLALGPVFTLKSFAAVGLMSLYVEVLPRLIGFAHLDPACAAVLGGLLAGSGILILIRHGASLGGIGVLAIYLQKTRGWRAGAIQMGADVVILAAGLAVLPPMQQLLSVLGAVALNFVIAVNHRTDRYFGV